MDRQDGNYLIYDGECPFCSRYVRLTRLRETIGSLRLVDARSGGGEVAAAIRAGYRLDDGMLLHLDGQDFYGADCLNRLALLSSRSTLFNRLTYVMFRSAWLSRVMYPVLRAGRNLILRLMGRRRLDF